MTQNKLRVGLVGYGSMGRLLEEQLRARGHSVTAIIDTAEPAATHKNLSRDLSSAAEIFIDFSHPSAMKAHLPLYAEMNTRAVIGTTGWNALLPEAEEAFQNSKGSLLWSSNFSIGVNLFFEVVRAASQLFSKAEDYDVWGHELHHAGKADSPSGTAKTICEILLQNIERKRSAVYDKLDRKRDPSEIHFSSVRGGLVNFEHTVAFDSPADSVIIQHRARNRAGYAHGAVVAAEWLAVQQAPGKIFGPDDFLEIIRKNSG